MTRPIALIMVAIVSGSGCISEIDDDKGDPEYPTNGLSSWSYDLVASKTPYLLIRASAPDNEPAKIEMAFQYFVIINDSPADDPNDAGSLRGGHCGGAVAGDYNQTVIVRGEGAFVRTEVPAIGTVEAGIFPLMHTANQHHELTLNVEAGGFIDILVWIDGYEDDPQAGTNRGSLQLESAGTFAIERMNAEGVCLTKPHEYQQSNYTTTAGDYEGSLANKLPAGTSHIAYIAMGADQRNDVRIDGPNQTIATWNEPVQGWFGFMEEVRSVHVTQTSSMPPRTILNWIAMDERADISMNSRPTIV